MVNAKVISLANINYIVLQVMNIGSLPTTGGILYVNNGIINMIDKEGYDVSQAIYQLEINELKPGQAKNFTIELNSYYFTEALVSVYFVNNSDDYNLINNYKCLSVMEEQIENNGNKHKLNYYIDGVLFETFEYEPGEQIDQYQPINKVGYTFSGWNGLVEFMPNTDLDVYGSYIVNSYEVNYFVDGVLYATETYNYNQILNQISPNLFKEGYTFSGWDVKLPEFMPAQNIEVNGEFIINSYEVNYYVDGELVETEEYEYGSEVTMFDYVAPTGYTFNGWNQTLETMPSKDVNIYGLTTINKYSVNYYVDEVLTYTDVINYNENIVLRANPVMTGYTFSGWSEIPDVMPANDLDVYGTFSINSYNINYYVDGELVKTDTFEYNALVSLYEYQAKSGYSFSGWSGSFETMPDYSVDLYGSNIINSYNVNYYVDGELTYTDKVQFNDTIVAKENPYKDGYTFSGWSEIPETMPANDVKVDGTFSINNYKINYYVDNILAKSETVAFNSNVTLYDYQANDGYTFSGWNQTLEVMPSRDVNLYGTTSINTYNVNYYVDGELTYTDKVQFNDTIVAKENPYKDGYTFSGWSEIPETMPANDVKVDGTFSINNYKINYYVDNILAKSETVAFNSNVTLYDYQANDGYTFSGWNQTLEVMPSRDVNLYGTTSINTYNVKYYVDDSLVFTDRITYNEKISIRDNPFKEGHTFSGWSEVPETMPAQDIIVKGTFKTNNYTLKYYVNGSFIKAEGVLYNSPITMYNYTPEEGYEFSGWNETIEVMPSRDVNIYGTITPKTYYVKYYIDGVLQYSDKVIYQDSITIKENPAKIGYTFSGWGEVPTTMPAHDVDVNGSFIVNKYQVKYYVDGVVIETDEYDYGSMIKHLELAPKEGYTFSGWNVTPKTMPAQNIDIYSTYSINSYTVEYYAFDKLVSTKLYKFGDKVDLTAYEAEWYTFNGWKLDESVVNELTMGAKNIKLYASMTAVEKTFVEKVEEAPVTTTVGVTAGSVTVLLGGIYLAIKLIKAKKGF